MGGPAGMTHAPHRGETVYAPKKRGVSLSALEGDVGKLITIRDVSLPTPSRKMSKRGSRFSGRGAVERSRCVSQGRVPRTQHDARFEIGRMMVVREGAKRDRSRAQRSEHGEDPPFGAPEH